MDDVSSSTSLNGLCVKHHTHFPCHVSIFNFAPYPGLGTRAPCGAPVFNLVPKPG